MGIMQVLRKKERRAYDHAEDTPHRTETPPPLMMLVPDAGGIATYSLHRFTSAKAAEFYLDSMLRGQPHEGTVLFWALNRQPSLTDCGIEGEPLVLIRDVRKPVTYPFSFADIGSAHDFIRHEMNRGLDLGQVMMYWAVPARIEIDFWGRSTIVPPAAPRLGPAPVEERLPAQPHSDQEQYLTEADVARAVRMMNEIAAAPSDSRIVKMPAPAAEREAAAELPHAPVIDFPSASQKLQQTKHDRVAFHAWANFALAIDDALDVHVARQVRAKLVWNRLMRALGEATAYHRRLAAEAAWHRVSGAISEAASAAETARRRAALHRAWLNAAWTLEEAVYAHRLEQRAQALREWRFATLAIAEALRAKTAHEAAMAYRAWSRIARGIGEALEARPRQLAAVAAWTHASAALTEAVLARESAERASLTWSNLAGALGEMTGAYSHRLAVTTSWQNAGCALEEAVSMYEFRERAVAGWANGTIAIKEAIVAEATLRIAQAGLARKFVAEVEKAVRSKTRTQRAAKAGKRAAFGAARTREKAAGSAQTAEKPDTDASKSPHGAGTHEDAAGSWRNHNGGRWEPREEPFRGFQSPPGRFYRLERERTRDI